MQQHLMQLDSMQPLLDDLVTDHDIIGIGWGKTIHAVATHLNTKDELSDVQVVQLKGSVSYSKHHTFAYESINAFANAYHAVPQYLPLPVIFDQKLTKDLAEKERHIQQLIELGKEANIAVFTVGTVRDSALVFQLNYFDDAEMKFLKQNAVGDVFFHGLLTNREKSWHLRLTNERLGSSWLIYVRKSTPFW